MATYLVTGACGFIGANYVRHVLEHDPTASVVGLDNLSFAANAANLHGLGDRVSMVVADIADFDAVMAVYRDTKPDLVVNLAAESHNDRAITAPSGFMRTNALGAQTMLECSRLVGVQRHLHVSTIEVYGELPPGTEWFLEGSPLNAKTPYSAAKAAGDQICRAYMHTYRSMDIAMTHCANNYGPYQLPEKLIPLMITNVLRGRRVPVYGDGLQRRDWLHVADHCAAIHMVLHADLPKVSDEAATDPSLMPIFDVSARHELTNLEIVHSVLEILGVEPQEWLEHVPDRPNHDRRYLINPTKIESTLDWRPRVNFQDGLKDTVQWYLENQDWWEAVFVEKGELQTNW